MEETGQSHTFGRWVAAWREALGLSMTAAAELAGWRVPFWHSIESPSRIRKDGEPSMLTKSTVLTIAEVLGLPEGLALAAAGYASAELHHLALCIVPPPDANRRMDMPRFTNFATVLFKTQEQFFQQQLHALQIAMASATFTACNTTIQSA